MEVDLKCKWSLESWDEPLFYAIVECLRVPEVPEAKPPKIADAICASHDNSRLDQSYFSIERVLMALGEGLPADGVGRDCLLRAVRHWSERTHQQALIQHGDFVFVGLRLEHLVDNKHLLELGPTDTEVRFRNRQTMSAMMVANHYDIVPADDNHRLIAACAVRAALEDELPSHDASTTKAKRPSGRHSQQRKHQQKHKQKQQQQKQPQQDAASSSFSSRSIITNRALWLATEWLTYCANIMFKRLVVGLERLISGGDFSLPTSRVMPGRLAAALEPSVDLRPCPPHLSRKLGTMGYASLARWQFWKMRLMELVCEEGVERDNVQRVGDVLILMQEIEEEAGVLLPMPPA